MTLLRNCVRLFLIGLVTLAPTAARAAQDFAFVHDRGTPNQVFAYQLASTGTLTPVAGSPFSTSAGAAGAQFCRGNCQTAAYAPKRQLLFVTGSVGISALRVGTNGALTEVAGSPFGPAGDYIGIAVVQKGRSTFVYAADVDSSRVRGFNVETSGALTELSGSPFATGATPVALTAGAGKLFCITQSARLVEYFTVATSGALTRVDDASVGTTGAFTLYTDPKAKTVYVPENSGGNEVLALKVGKTGLTTLPGSPFSSDVSTSSGLVYSPKWVVAMSLTSAVGTDLQVYKRSAKGPLQKVVTQSSGLLGIRSGAVKGKLLVLASDDGDAVRTYTVATNGTLTVVDTKPAAALDFANQVLILRR
ncbi:MAG: hypothetical protein K0Q72_3404 [Armatimonadetes bacterium]|jgi:6-phosphogluconolactonase (cycloisomerase 2 family)|nr:hypothetical protein [Armatimonadota bacterium]